METLIDNLSRYTSLTDNRLKTYLSHKDIPQHLLEVMSYSIFAGGKRLRPALLLSTYELFSSDLNTPLPFACAIEMIHTYSLIHDDLPALDNDMYRRGKLTSHAMFDEARAILAGDALLSYAFEIMVNECVNTQNPNALKAAQYISKAAGVFGMVAGQWQDVVLEGQQISNEMLHFIHTNKTGALINGAILAGAVLGNAKSDQIRALYDYGCCIGLAFQITDDILDVTGCMEETGKTSGIDAINQKTTYVSQYGLEGAKMKAEEYIDNAIAALSCFDSKAEFHRQLAKNILTRKS